MGRFKLFWYGSKETPKKETKSGEEEGKEVVSHDGAGHGMVATGSASGVSVNSSVTTGSVNKSGLEKSNSKSKSLLSSNPANDVFSSLVGSSEEDALGVAGLQALMKGLDLSENDLEMLVFIFFCKCVSLLDVTREEFVTGCSELKVSSLVQLKSKLKESTKTLIESLKDFTEFYKFVFQACREGTIKTIPKESVIYLLPICFSRSNATQQKFVNYFCKFLESSTTTKHIKSDEWNSFLLFVTQVKDIKDYDDSGHYPLLIDSFVEWLFENKFS